MFNRIWKKLAFALLVVTFVPIYLFGYQDLQNEESKMANEALREIFLNVVTRGKEIERAFLNTTVDINLLRSSIALEFLLDMPPKDSGGVEYWRKIVEEEFIRFLSLKHGYSRIGLIDDYGDEVVVVYRSGKQVLAVKRSQKRNRLTSPYYVGAAQQDKYGIAAIPLRNSLHHNQDVRRISLVRNATKVFDSKGKPRGVIYIDLNGSEIFQGLAWTSLERKRQAALVTNEGNYIFNPFVESDSSLPPKHLPGSILEEYSELVLEQILSGSPGMMSDDPDFLFAYSPVFLQAGDRSKFYVVFDRYSRAEFAPKLSGIKKMYAIGALGALLLAIVVSIIVSRTLTRHINKLRQGVERFAEHEFGHRIIISSKDEIESLATAYNQMAGSLQEYSESLEKKVEERSKRVEQVERQLIQAEKLAAIGFLGAGVAHEINNPVSIIITRLELVQKAVKKGDMTNVIKDIEVLKNHAARIGRITGDLLTFSRQSSSDLSSVDLNEIVKRVIGLIEYPIRNKGIDLTVELSPHEPKIKANSTGMEQVIYNITHNAYQATGPGGEIALVTRLNGAGDVELVIRDTGEGIDEESLDRVFEPFYSTKEVGQGTGLGLSISYGLVKDFGGSIEVQSEPGVGTSFTITLACVGSSRANDKREVVKTNA